MSYRLMNEILGNIVKESTEANKPVVKNKVSEAELGYAEVDSLMESAMKENLKTVIKESGLGIEELEEVNKTVFNADQVNTFAEETINPILETVGTMKSGLMLSDKNVKAVSLPVYEVALTLESARRGALTDESLADTVLKEAVEPDAQELSEIIRDIVENNIKDKTHGGSCIESPYYKKSKKQMNEAVTVKQLTDVHQYAKNKKKMALTANSSQPSQPTQNKGLPKKVSDLHKWEGEEETGQNGMFSTFEETLDENTVLEQIYNELMEAAFTPMKKNSKGKVAVSKAKSDPKVAGLANLHNFQGHQAGKPSSEKRKDNNFKLNGTADEIIANEQTEISKYLLGRIFNEYGIKDPAQRKAVIKEAVHNIFKYGVKNLIPAVSDVAAVVNYQNNLAESVEGEYTSKFIVENTEAELSDEQVEYLVEVGIDYAETLLEAFEIKNDYENNQESEFTDEDYDNATLVIESISFITSANELERKRQAFRYRMNKFNENAKLEAASNWVVLESNSEFDDLLTVRRYVTEAEDLKKYFSVLKEDSPIYSSVIKKQSNNNEELTLATVFTEAFVVWRKLKDSYYNNNAPLESKLFALEATLNGVEKYKDSVKNYPKAKMVFENFSYRLNSLKDKVLTKLNG